MVFTRRAQVLLIIFLSITAIALLFSNSAKPDNPVLFGLKRYQENIFYNFKGDKIDYSNTLLAKRLEELKGLANGESARFLWAASLRYSTTAGRITEMIKGKNSKEKALKQIEAFNKDKKEIEQKLEEFPKDFGTDDWKFLEDAINYLNIYIKQLQEVVSGA